MTLLADLALGVALFIATDIDDIVILLAFFADPKFRTRQIVAGQYAGIGVLVLFSLMAALIALVIPPAYIGLLGLVPIAIGANRLRDWRPVDSDHENARSPHASGAEGQWLAVAAVTIANGGDNIGVYTPVFAVGSSTRTIVIVAVFAVMTALWCVLAHWLVNHAIIGAQIRRYGARVLPFVLIGLGIVIVLESGTLELLHRR